MQWLGQPGTVMQPESAPADRGHRRRCRVDPRRERTRPLLQAAPFPSGVMLVTSVSPFRWPLRTGHLAASSPNATPVTVFDRFMAARASPSVLDWPAYYEALQRSIAPPLPVPRGVVDETSKADTAPADRARRSALQLRARRPDRRLLHQPGSIYGHYFQPAARYLAEYVHQEDGERSTASVLQRDPSLLPMRNAGCSRNIGSCHTCSPILSTRTDLAQAREADVGRDPRDGAGRLSLVSDSSRP